MQSMAAIVTPVNYRIVSFPSSSQCKKQSVFSVSLPRDVLIGKKKKSLLVSATSEDHGPIVSKLGQFTRRVRKAATDLEEVRKLRSEMEKNTVEVFEDDDLTNHYGRILMKEQECIIELHMATLALNQLEKILFGDEWLKRFHFSMVLLLRVTVLYIICLDFMISLYIWSSW